MFYCYACGEEKGWPTEGSRSLGQCEVCEKQELCTDVPSKLLPKPSTKLIDSRLYLVKRYEGAEEEFMLVYPVLNLLDQLDCWVDQRGLHYTHFKDDAIYDLDLRQLPRINL